MTSSPESTTQRHTHSPCCRDGSLTTVSPPQGSSFSPVAPSPLVPTKTSRLLLSLPSGVWSGPFKTSIQTSLSSSSTSTIATLPTAHSSPPSALTTDSSLYA